MLVSWLACDLVRDAQTRAAVAQIERGEKTIRRVLRTWQILSTDLDPASVKALQSTISSLQAELKNLNQLIK